MKFNIHKSIVTILSVVLTVVFVAPILRSEPNAYVINRSQAVDILTIDDVSDLWSAVKIDHPDSLLIFSYKCKDVDFQIFDLKSGNKYAIIISKSLLAKIKLMEDGEDISKTVKNCYLNNTKGGVSELNRHIGYVLDLEDSKTYNLICETPTNRGDYIVNLNRSEKGWLTGSVSVR